MALHAGERARVLLRQRHCRMKCKLWSSELIELFLGSHARPSHRTSECRVDYTACISRGTLIPQEIEIARADTQQNIMVEIICHICIIQQHTLAKTTRAR